MATECNSSTPCHYPHSEPRPAHERKQSHAAGSGSRSNRKTGIQAAIKATKQAEAGARAAYWHGLDLTQQLAELRRRPGSSSKQTGRIIARIVQDDRAAIEAEDLIEAAKLAKASKRAKRELKESRS